jgi:hypothetical protein
VLKFTGERERERARMRMRKLNEKMFTEGRMNVGKNE